MNGNVGEINLALTLDSENLSRQLQSSVSEIQRSLNGVGESARSAGNSLITEFGSSIKKITGILVGFAALKGLANFGKECVELGSDLQEVQNVVDVTFSSMSAQVDTFAQSAATSFGLSETMAKKYVGTFGAMSKAFGFTETAAYEMATTLTGLAGDVASFYNLSQDEAYTKLKSVFTGETESLKDLGVVMTQTALDSYALANGFGKTTSEMTEQEKVALRYQFVLNQLSLASDDFIRTSDGWANQTRILALQVDSLKATIGQGLINALTPVIKTINLLLSKLATAANAFKAFTELIFGDASGDNGEALSTTTSELGDAASQAMEAASDGADSLSSSTAGVGEAAKKAAKEMRSLMGFDSINKLSEQDSDDGSSSSSPTSSGSIPSSINGLGSEVDFGKLSSGETVFDDLISKGENFVAILRKIKDLFLSGFEIGFGNSLETIDSIKTHLLGIKTSLMNIFGDAEIVAAAQNLFQSLVYNAGAITGAFASIGLTIANNLIGGLDQHLTDSQEYIKQHILSIVNVSADISGLSGDFAIAMQDVFSVFNSGAAVQCTADFIGIVSSTFLGIVDLGLQFVADMINLVTQPFVDNVEEIKLAIENTLQPISTILGTIRQGFEDTFNKACEVYQTSISPMFSSFAQGISDIVNALLDGYNTYVAPVLDELADKFKTTWEEHIQPAIDSFLEMIGDLSETVQSIWDETVQPFIEWVADNVMPTISPIVDYIGDSFLTALGDLADALGAVFDKLGDIITKIGEATPSFEELKQWVDDNEDALILLTAAVAGLTVAYGLNTVAANATAISQAAASAVIGAYNAVTGVATAVTGAFSAALAFLTSTITLVVLAITGLVAVGILLYKNWDEICAKAKKVWGDLKNWFKSTLNSIGQFFKDLWQGIKKVFSKVGGWFKEKFEGAWDNIKSAFSSVGEFFSGIWTSIKDTFTGIGETIGSAVTDAFKSAINAVFETIESKVNGFIDMINGVIGIINKIPGVELGTVGKVSLPRLAQGGYVKANTPQLAMIGDNKTQGEIVAPENKMLEMARIAAKESNSGSGDEIVTILLKILAYLQDNDVMAIDPETIRKYMIKKTNQNTKARGVSELLT